MRSKSTMLARALVLAGCCLPLMGVTPAVAMRTTHVSTEGETFAGFDGAGCGVSEQMLDGVEPELSDDEELGQPTLVSPAPGSLIAATSPVQMLPLRVDRDGDVFMQVQGVDCFAGPWAARAVDWTVRWVVYRLQTRGCGTVKHRYSETGNIGGKRTATAQYTEASHITATELGCGRAKAIVRRYLTTWRSYNHGPGRVKGYRCSYDRAGSDIGSGLCTRAERAAIEFDLYDSSPFH